MNGGDALPDENAGTLAVPIPPADMTIIQDAAAARGLSAESFAADLLHLVASERLISAVMDDGIGVDLHD